MVSTSNQEKSSAIQVLKFLHQTIQTLNVYEKHLKAQIDTELKLSEM